MFSSKFSIIYPACLWRRSIFRQTQINTNRGDPYAETSTFPRIHLKTPSGQGVQVVKDAGVVCEGSRYLDTLFRLFIAADGLTDRILV